jgi:hypothetical protein
MKLNRDLREFIELFHSHKVEYLVVGAHALAWYGLPRYTKDIDFWVNPSEGNADALMRVLDDFGFGDIGVTRDDFLKPDHVIQLGQEPYRIDMMTGISGLTWKEAFDSRVQGEVDGLPVQFIGPNQYIRNKEASGRPQDYADADRLKKILESG